MAKLSKASVDYRHGGPHCHACAHFIEGEHEGESETGTCELVAGSIDEHALCDKFKWAMKIRPSNLQRRLATGH